MLYCKFWVLDEDHDLIISENDLLNYNDGLLSRKITRQIMNYGRIPAFTKADHTQQSNLEEGEEEKQEDLAQLLLPPGNKLTFIDYICKLYIYMTLVYSFC